MKKETLIGDLKMKKTITKTILTILTIALMMTPFMAMSAFASEASDTGMFPPDKGDLYIHKYVGSPIGNDPHDGTKLDTNSWTTVVPANNVIFDIYKVGGPVNGEWPAIPVQGDYSLVGGNLVVTDGEGKAGEYTLGEAESIITGDGHGPGVAVAEDLLQGIYLVIENGATGEGIKDPSGNHLSISVMCAPFLVAVPMTNPEGTGWLKEVHVYPKNEKLSITIDVDVKNNINAVVVGEKVTYTLNATVPSDVATGTKYEISSGPSPALDVIESTIEVKTSKDEFILNTDYEVTYANDILTVTFLPAGLIKLGLDNNVDVIFEATVNSEILAIENYTISNSGKVVYTHGGMNFEAETKEDVDIHTAAIEILKTDANTAAVLPGAEFKIATDGTYAEEGFFLRQNKTSMEIFDYDPSEESEWAKLGPENDLTVISNGSGLAKIEGIRDIVKTKMQTYYLVETKAPANYNLLIAPQEAEFLGGETNYTLHVDVENSKGFLLPVTGGTGTIIWTVVGIALMGIGGIVVITRKKRNAEVI